MSPVDWEDRSTVLRPQLGATATEEAHFTLIVIDGADRARTFELGTLHAARVLVGHGPVCDVRLVDREISRRHLSLDLEGDRVRIVDLGSTNGTFVEGVRIGTAFLAGGETVRLGSTSFRIEQRRAATPAASSRSSFGRVLGASPEMRRIYPVLDKLAASSVSVLIEGETGTGKELLAESIHEASPRAAGPYVVFDCTAVPPSLVESELFGHERGAFTGATTTRRGVFEQASGGTLLIDEIGDLDLALQPKLLRALERGEVRRLGGERSIRFDVRVLSATRRDLDQEVQRGRFRDDLFHRLVVTRIELPPLRRRRGDIALLAERFWTELGGEPGRLPAASLRRWSEDGWAGNIRELRNAIAREIALGGLANEHAPVHEPTLGETESFLARALELPFSRARQEILLEFERRYVEHALARHGGSAPDAAREAGIAPRYFRLLRAKSSR